MSDAEVHKKVAEHDALIAQMNARINAIERRLLALESHGPALVVGVGLGLALLATVYKFL